MRIKRVQAFFAKLLRRPCFQVRDDLADRAIDARDDEVHVIVENGAREDDVLTFKCGARET